ncbi:MAG: 16S rRNA (uracil(1498)-N(3))-methyltransferase [Actinobacteria bacterium]|nr:16S rRNA (uracil(1498)-N(3))-methyltransferase [Actinomycetota bacterium]
MNPALRDSAAHVFLEAIDNPVLGDEDAHHLLRVLRLGESDPVTVTDGAGRWMTALVGKDGSVEPTSEVVVEAAPKWRLTIAFSLVKGDRPEWTIQKLTELGIDEIIVLGDLERSVVRWETKRAEKNLQRLRLVAREAAMQSRRVWLPIVSGLRDLATIDDLYIADPAGAQISGSHRTLAIGPEGGFTDIEKKTGVGLVSLGDNVLRAETAAISAAVLMSSCRTKEG